MNRFVIHIQQLSKKEHTFHFHIGETFFNQYGKEVVSDGDFEAKIIINKRETLIEADFTIWGKAHLVCDRSLDSFDFQMKIDKKVIFKFGEIAEEISDEIISIPYEQNVLDVGQLMYEFIVLEVPIKKIHPRFEENENEEGKWIYQTDKDESIIDPRWEVLKKLKK